MTGYKKRVADALLAEKLSYMGAVLVQGPKWCGKTTTSHQAVRSEVSLEDSVKGRSNRILAQTRPDKLLEGAMDALVRHGVESDDVSVAWVPGSFEIPLIAQKMAASGKYDAVIALGAVIKGSTDHYDYVCAEVSKGVAQASLASGVPVMFGVLTTENIEQAIERAGNVSFGELSDVIKKTAFKVTRMGQLVACEASKRLDAPFGIIDLSLAPTPAVGDSVAHILEAMGVEVCGAHGTTAALAMLNDAVKKGGAMASSHVGGLSGAFIPVSEDQGMIDAVSCGALTIEKLEAMTCVSSVGLDMIAIPGDTPATTIAGIIADEAAIGMINSKTTAVRVIPAYGKKEGDIVSFGGLLGYAPVIKVSSFGSDKFVLRGGRIPAPIYSMRN